MFSERGRFDGVFAAGNEPLSARRHLVTPWSIPTYPEKGSREDHLGLLFIRSQSTRSAGCHIYLMASEDGIGIYQVVRSARFLTQFRIQSSPHSDIDGAYRKVNSFVCKNHYVSCSHLFSRLYICFQHRGGYQASPGDSIREFLSWTK